MTNKFSIKVNLYSDTDAVDQDLEDTIQKDMEKAIKAVCIKHAVDLYQITVDPVL